MAYDPNSTEGVPEAGRARLQQNRAGLFTSDLSVNEFLLVREAGFRPLGLVIGSSIYHIGFQQASYRQNQEMTVLSQAMYHARELAMTRMEEEADQLGADGVVGVRLDIGRYEWGENLAEFIAVGTAVKHRGRRASPRPLRSVPSPATSRARSSGRCCRPATGRLGTGDGHRASTTSPTSRCARACATSARTSSSPNYTQALYDARELAMERMQAEALEAKAEGIVGVDLHERSHGWGSHVIEFFAIGTAIIPAEGSEDHVIPAPQMVLDLS